MEEEFTLKLDPLKGTATLNGIPISKVAGLAEVLSQIIIRIEALEAGNPTPTPTPEPTPEPSTATIPDWLMGAASRIDAFNKVYLGTDNNGIASFKNGNTTNADAWMNLNYPAQESLIGVRYNGNTGGFDVI
jgi:hypothetical protein